MGLRLAQLVCVVGRKTTWCGAVVLVIMTIAITFFFAAKADIHLSVPQKQRNRKLLAADKIGMSASRSCR